MDRSGERRLRMNKTIVKGRSNQEREITLERVIEDVKALAKITWHFARTMRRFI